MILLGRIPTWMPTRTTQGAMKMQKAVTVIAHTTVTTTTNKEAPTTKDKDKDSHAHASTDLNVPTAATMPTTGDSDHKDTTAPTTTTTTTEDSSSKVEFF